VGGGITISGVNDGEYHGRGGMDRDLVKRRIKEEVKRRGEFVRGARKVWGEGGG
jgi:hypothetical protein